MKKIRRRLEDRNFNNSIARMIKMIEDKQLDPQSFRVQFDGSLNTNSMFEAYLELVLQLAATNDKVAELEQKLEAFISSSADAKEAPVATPSAEAAKALVEEAQADPFEGMVQETIEGESVPHSEVVVTTKAPRKTPVSRTTTKKA
jgi:hypothetical protein